MQDRESISFFCEPMTLLILKLQDQALRVLEMRAQDFLGHEHSKSVLSDQFRAIKMLPKHIRALRFIL